MLDYDKIAVFQKLPLQESKTALLEYLKDTFGVKVARNYSFERIVQTAEVKIREAAEAKAAEEGHEGRSAGFVRTIVTPQEILAGKAGAMYDLKTTGIESAPKIGDGPLTYEEHINMTTPQAPMIPVRIMQGTGQGIPATQYVGSPCDIILPDTFKPMFNLSMRTPDGKECTTLGYWIIDEILEMGAMWKLGALTSRYHNEMMSLIYYIQKHGEVIVRETRHSHYVILR